jgi:branched-chain amino acid transport system substrate-binding protein
VQRSKLLFVISAMSCALVMCACGDEDSSESARAKSTATGTPLKIGVLVNATGIASQGQGNAVTVLNAWAKAVNAEGGLANHPVQFAVEDTKGSGPAATAAAARVARDKRIVALLLFDLQTEAIYADAVTKAGLPVIGGMGVAPNAWGAKPNWLPLTTTYPAVINMGMVMAKEAGATKTAFAVCAENPGCSLAAPLAKKATQTLGMQYAGDLKVSASAPDYTAQCLQLKEDGVDYLGLGLDVQTAMRLAGACKTQQYGGQYGVWTGTVVPKLMVENDPGVPLSVGLTSFPWWVDDAPVAAYREMMEAQAVSEDVWADPHSTAAYATVELFRKTVEANRSRFRGTPTRKDVLEAYGTIKDETLDGLLAQPVTFTPGKPEPLNNCYWLARFENGEFSGADLGKPTCDPPSLQGPPPG